MKSKQNPRRRLYRIAIPDAGILSLSEVHFGFEGPGFRHQHPELMQVLFVLEGAMELMMSGKPWTLRAGDSLVIPGRVWHVANPAVDAVHAKIVDLRVGIGQLSPLYEFLYARRDFPFGHGSLPVLRGHAEELRRHAQGLPETTAVHAGVLAAVWSLLNAVFTTEKAAAPAAGPAGDPRVAMVETQMREKMDRLMPVEEMAAEAGLSRAQLTRLFLQATGEPPARRYRAIRLQRAAQLLCFSRLSVAEIARTCGFSNANHFSRVFQRHLGMTATQYRAYNAWERGV